MVSFLNAENGIKCSVYIGYKSWFRSLNSFSAPVEGNLDELVGPGDKAHSMHGSFLSLK